nr:S41 family peptidase [Pseudopedobacter sp.]
MKNPLIILVHAVVLNVSINCIAQVPQKTIHSSSLDIKVLIDSLTNSVKKHYIFPEKSVRINKYLKEQYKKGVYDVIRDPNQLAYRLIEDIRKVNYDSHFNIFYQPKDAEHKETLSEREENIKDQVAFERESNFKFKKLEILPGGIGYIQFNEFIGNVKGAKPTLTAAMTFLKNSKAIIIDLRYNGGGSPEMVNQVESYFFKERVHMLDMLSTFSKDTMSLYTDPTSTDGLLLSMPIYILTSKNTFSGAEDFSYAMQTQKRAIVVGETTGGGAHAAFLFSIGQGFWARVPFARAINPITLTDWEDVGVIPDITVAASEALIKVQEIIYQDLFTKAKTEREKKIIQWAKNDLKGKTNLLKLTATELEQYSGTFEGGIIFYVENGSILCKNPERGGTDIFTLHPVTKNVFLLDENVQIEFVKDSQEKYSSLKMLWIDGNVTTKRKE